MQLHRQLVGGHHGTVVADGDLLRAKQHLGDAGLHGLRALAQQMPEQHLGQLLDHQRRHVDAVAEERHIRRLERWRPREARAKAQPDRVVLADVGIGEARQLGLAHRPARHRHQLLVQRELGGARFGQGRELGAQQRRAQEVVGQREAPVRPRRQQSVAAGVPEIRHQVPNRPAWPSSSRTGRRCRRAMRSSAPY